VDPALQNNKKIASPSQATGTDLGAGTRPCRQRARSDKGHTLAHWHTGTLWPGLPSELPKVPSSPVASPRLLTLLLSHGPAFVCGIPAPASSIHRLPRLYNIYELDHHPIQCGLSLLTFLPEGDRSAFIFRFLPILVRVQVVKSAVSSWCLVRWSVFCRTGCLEFAQFGKDFHGLIDEGHWFNLTAK
jgi:hypothetical protein